MAKYWIGIDPGENTGVAIWDAGKQCFVSIFTTTAASAILHIWSNYVGWNNDTIIVFEDARKRQWIPREKNLSEYRGRLMGAGSVKRDCTIWEEFCKDYNFNYLAVPPRRGETKWDADYFARVTGWTKRTSNHARDAALLVYGK